MQPTNCVHLHYLIRKKIFFRSPMSEELVTFGCISTMLFDFGMKHNIPMFSVYFVKILITITNSSFFKKKIQNYNSTTYSF